MKLLDGFSWFLNPVWLMDKFFTLWGGGGGSQTSTGTTYTSNIPEYAQPFYEEAMKQAAKNVFTTDTSGNVTGVKPYTPYTGERVAPLTTEQKAVQQNIMGLQTPAAFQAAQSGLGGSRSLASGAGGLGLSKALAYDPAQAYAERVGVSGFSPQAAAYYMDPYQQNVTNIALREAAQKGALDKQALMTGAIGRGTFGGARNALLQAEQNRNLSQNLSDIQAKGSQAAYQNAQQQFNADIARQLEAQKSNQQAGLTAQQLTQQGQTAAAQLAGQTGIAGLNASIDAAKAQAATAAAEQTANLERLKTQATTAQEAQAIQQKIDDLKYQTFMEQQNWAKAQLEFYNAMLHGTPGLASTQVQYAPTPSAASQIGGLGLGALALTKALG